METRLVGTGIALFLCAYAQASPLFTFFGVRVDVALAFAVLTAFSFGALYECAFLVIVAAYGLAAGIGFVPALLFFAAVFVTTQGVLRALPWQPFLAGCAIVLLFSFLTYVSSDWSLMVSLALPAAREALCNVAVFAALYAFLPPRYARL